MKDISLFLLLATLMLPSCQLTKSLTSPLSAQSSRPTYKDNFTSEEVEVFKAQETEGSSGYQKLLRNAVKNKDISGIAAALKGGANPNTSSYPDPSAIGLTFTNNCPSCLEAMAPRMNINYGDRSIHSFPLAMACSNSLSNCKLLIEKYGADVNAVFTCSTGDRKRCNILKAVANNWSVPDGVIQYLISKGADPNGGTDPTWSTYMSSSLFKYRKASEIESIISAGVNPTYGIPAALDAEKWDIIKLLIENGADVNYTFTRGQDFRLLYFAIKENKIELVRFLLDHGAKTDRITFGKWPKSALDIAMDSDRTEQSIIDALIAADSK